MSSPRYTKCYDDENGKRRAYTRIPGQKPVALPGLVWSTEFMDALASELAKRKAPESVGADRTLAGTVNAGLVAYYRSTDFTDGLAAGTQRIRRHFLEHFRERHGAKRLKMLERPHVQAYISSLKGAATQRNSLLALKHFLSYCVTTHLIPDNPAEGARHAKLRSTGHRAWTEDDYARYCAHFPIGTMARLAIALYVNLGVRKSDVIRLGPRMVRDGVLTEFQPQKTSRTTGWTITVPLLEETKQVIAATAHGIETYLVTSRGKPFTSPGFGNKMRQWCDEAGLPDCSSHGLRKLCLVRLAELELPDGRVLDLRDLQAISGHKNLRELQGYIENADRTRRARRAIAQLEEGQKIRPIRRTEGAEKAE